MSDVEPLAPKLLGQFAGGLARPLESGDRIARRRIVQQFIQRF
jgi:hypothetical protein